MKQNLVDLSYKAFKTTEVARCIKARYTAAPTNHSCEDSGVLITGGKWILKKHKITIMMLARI